MSGSRAAPAWVLLAWLAAGFVATVCGIGGGLYAVPILHFLLGLDLRTSVATSLPIVMAMTASGTVAEALRPDSALSLPLVVLLCIGSFGGARVGKTAADLIGGDALRAAFVLLLLFVGSRVVATPSVAAGARGLLAFDLTFGQCLLVVLIGFLGGFVAPILGIGGGLIVVPALYLGVPDVDYLHARASSTAMSVVTSAQLAWMYAREGRIDRRSVVSLGTVALLAGALGVFAVHQPGWAEAARVLMAVTLFGISARFLWDLRPSARERRRREARTLGEGGGGG